MNTSSGAIDGAGAWFDPTQVTEEDDAAFATWLGDVRRGKVLHDAKGPLLAFLERGWSLAGLTSDTQLSAYLVRPDQRAYDLADLTVAQAALDEVMKNRTTFVIAHRLATIRKATKILVFDGGRIVETGTFEELHRLGGRFAQLTKMQFSLSGVLPD